MTSERATVISTEAVQGAANGRLALAMPSAPALSRRLSQGAMPLGDQMIASATTFLTAAIVARLCAPEEFGAYSLGFSVVAFLMGVQASLICTPYMVTLPRLSGRGVRLYTGSVFAHAVLLGIAASFVLGAVVVAARFSGATGPVPRVLGMMATVLVLLLVRDCIRQVCFARLMFASAFAFDAVLAVLQLGGIVAVAGIGMLSGSTAFLVLGGACAIAAAAWALVHRKEIEVAFEHIGSHWNTAWTTGKYVFASGLVWGVAMNLYVWVIAYFHGAAGTAVWAACFGVITLVNPLLLGVQNGLGPKIAHAFARSGVVGMRRFVFQSALAFFLIMALFALAMAMVGDRIVAAIFGASYVGHGLLVTLLAANTALITLGFCPSRGLFAMDRAEVDFRINGLALLMLLIVGVPLVKMFGPIGAAAGQLATSAVAAGARWTAFWKLADSRPEAAGA